MQSPNDPAVIDLYSIKRMQSTGRLELQKTKNRANPAPHQLI
jgi:hypothetical protein